MGIKKDLDYRLYVQREEGFIRSDYRNELRQYNRIKNGDVEGTRDRYKIARAGFKDGWGKLSDDPLRNAQYHLVASAAVISRICIDGGMEMNAAYTLSDIYINKADEARSPEEVIDILGDMQIDYATRMRDLKRTNAINLHIRRTVDYIYDNLDKPITLTELAEREELNPEYLSRLFMKETGKKIGEFIAEAKIKSAQYMLCHTDYSILDVALSLGYASQSSFTKAFTSYSGVSPKKYRDQNTTKVL